MTTRGDSDELMDSFLRMAFRALAQESPQLVTQEPSDPAATGPEDEEEQHGGGLLIDTFDDEELYGEREPRIDPQTGFAD